MLDALLAALPGGYTVVRDDPLNPLDPKASLSGIYQAYFTVRQGKQTGLVLVEVHDPQSPIGDRWEGDGCALALAMWPVPRGRCQLMTTGQTKVGVAQSQWGDRFAQWAGYRHPDGVVVKVAQISRPDRYWKAPPELKKLPFTVQQLADLAVNERFHVS
ncbi:hypothetical protein MRQ36_27650 [Micromonospora sp. R77]|uniref:hypothetical protein n=1 Tax=Micromonospora sp. R77 TaxID=2925836 RepID=UPI001F60E0D8|nr:hypothetical protein [Micromonospora sp. R77]MCI4066119.1 hypothetical protein [Micromonospora sp. R77]